jgi:hypothetical protein
VRYGAVERESGDYLIACVDGDLVLLYICTVRFERPITGVRMEIPVGELDPAARFGVSLFPP